MNEVRAQSKMAMTTMTTASIVDLNKRGIVLLRGWDADSAIECFTEALSRTRKVVFQKRGGENIASRRSVQELRMPTRSSMTRTFAVESFGTRDFARLPHEHFNVYSRAFALENNVASQAEGALSSAILLYNLAFAYHCKGTNQAFQRAVRYYRFGLRVIRDSLPAPANVDMLLVTLAILNNLGHVFSLLSRTADAQTCGERILFLLESSVPAFLAQHDVEFFHFVEFYTQDEDPVSIAAAA